MEHVIGSEHFEDCGCSKAEEASQEIETESRINDLFDFFNWGGSDRVKVMEKVIESDFVLQKELLSICVSEAATFWHNSRNRHLNRVILRAVTDFAREEIATGTDNWPES